VIVCVHFGASEWARRLPELVNSFAHDKSLVIAEYNTFSNLPFPELLQASNKPELATKERFFQYFPKGDKTNPVRFSVGGTLLEAIIEVCKARRSDLRDVAQALRFGSLQKTLRELAEIEEITESLLLIRNYQLYEKESIDYKKEKRKKDKVTKELAKLRSKAALMQEELKKTAEDLKREVHDLEESFTDAMFSLQESTLKDIERLPEEGFKEALERILNERKDKDQRVVVFFSRNGCLPCFESSFPFARLSALLPDVKFAWADASAVDLLATPKCYIYESSPTEPTQKLNFPSCMKYCLDLYKQTRPIINEPTTIPVPVEKAEDDSILEGGRKEIENSGS